MKVVDPVCAIVCDPAKAVSKVEYKGKTYYFCALGCKEEFERDPERYVGHERSGLQSELSS